MFKNILAAYGIRSDVVVQPFGSGLIHKTWKILDHDGEYILQKINHNVFKNPGQIADNIERIASWLKNASPGYFLPVPVKTKNGESFLDLPGEGYFRVFPFVKDSHTYDIAQTPQQAYQAARQFGRFTRTLNDFPVADLNITLPDFHNLSARYAQFEQAAQKGNPSRIRDAQETIQYLYSNNSIVSTYVQIVSDKSFKLRVTHHDTKISNILFDGDDKGICVIDLDTMMPGYFISDAGDMMRTYLSPVSEEEKDLSKIIIRENFFYGIARGYLEEMGSLLSPVEIEHFVYSGMFMIYMQALRFLTDYLNDDVYYGSSYPGHNFNRAKNQATLLARLLERSKDLNKMVARIHPTH